jgi:hypothetical protein
VLFEVDFHVEDILNKSQHNRLQDDDDGSTSEVQLWQASARGDISQPTVQAAVLKSTSCPVLQTTQPDAVLTVIMDILNQSVR